MLTECAWAECNADMREGATAQRSWPLTWVVLEERTEAIFAADALDFKLAVQTYETSEMAIV